MRLDRRQGAARARGANGADALVQHQAADRTQEHDIAAVHDELDLAELLQNLEQVDAERRAGEAAGEKDRAHLDVDALAGAIASARPTATTR